MSTSPETGAAGATPIRPAWSLPKGRILLRVLRDDPTQEYLLYLPTSHSAGCPVLVSVHGISRNAIRKANAFAGLCEQLNIALLVPVFTADGHTDYQRLGRANRGPRADRTVNRCLEEVAALSGSDVTQFYLQGFSGGAQFAHRYAMAHPHRVLVAFVVAAGWYTFPDTTQKYPYGIRHNRQLADVKFNPEQFLHVPIHVLVGENDTGVANVRRTPRADAQQGTTRVARATNWVSAMHASADQFGIPRNVTLHVAPDVDHSFNSFCRRGQLVERIGSLILERARQEYRQDSRAGEVRNI